MAYSRNYEKPVQKVPKNPQTGKPTEHDDAEFVPGNECSPPIDVPAY